MSVIESPTNPLIQAQVDSTYDALRVSLSAREWQVPLHVGGHYKGSWRTGNTTVIAGGGAIFSMRWANAQFNMLLQRLKVTAAIGTVFTTAQELALDAVRVINFSTQDTGGTALDPLLKSAGKDTTMGVSQLAALRIATTAALTPGTGTAETTTFAGDSFPITNTLGLAASIDLFDMRPGEQTPQIFRSNEGFRIRLVPTMGAAGVVVFTVNMEWGEIPNQ